MMFTCLLTLNLEYTVRNHITVLLCEPILALQSFRLRGKISICLSYRNESQTSSVQKRALHFNLQIHSFPQTSPYQ